MQKSLAEVKLTEAARIRASSYSGGMKRRLSVAIALIGEPKLVILDEPVSCVGSFILFIFLVSADPDFFSLCIFTCRQLAWIQ